MVEGYKWGGVCRTNKRNEPGGRKVECTLCGASVVLLDV